MFPHFSVIGSRGVPLTILMSGKEYFSFGAGLLCLWDKLYLLGSLCFLVKVKLGDKVNGSGKTFYKFCYNIPSGGLMQ